MTVAIAMAGMFLAGASTFTSFAVGTITVVAIAVIGSLTVLPGGPVQARRPREQGRIPFLMRPEERAARESRVWSAILDRVLRRPVVAAIGSTAVLLVLAIPVLNLKLAVPGFETLPQDLAVIQTYDRIQAAFPGNQIPADVVVERPDASDVELTIGVHNLRERSRRASWSSRRSRSNSAPITASRCSTCRSSGTGRTTPPTRRSPSFATSSFPRPSDGSPASRPT